MPNNRVCCLYRVSTLQQVDFNTVAQADIPMQRKACHRFAEEKGWVVVHEEQEDGISGHKVRAEHRDKIQLIKDYAKNGKFDILLVFMFDRIGRIADETPFVVEWFVRNGIQVWSTQEGEQRFDSHTDKLVNYIRFWQADGESEKTSIRTKTRLGQIVEEGHFKGGNAPYGYHLVKSGRLNKRKHELLELVINEIEADVVKLIYNKYVNDNYGAQRIATYLNQQGLRARTGRQWHPASIRGILCNLTYTGVLRSGESRSQVLPHLQIISSEQFEIAQQIRINKSNETPSCPLPIKQSSTALLSGIVYCGHCGARLTPTSNTTPRPSKSDPEHTVKRVRYICYGKTRKQTECDGQTGYTAHILESIVDRVVRQILDYTSSNAKGDVVDDWYHQQVATQEQQIHVAGNQLNKAQREYQTLRGEVVKSIQGESHFSQQMVATLIAEAEEKCKLLQERLDAMIATQKESNALLESLHQQYDEIASWSVLYDSASIKAKQMVIRTLINRIEVSRNYQLRIQFNIRVESFGLDLPDNIVDSTT